MPDFSEAQQEWLRSLITRLDAFAGTVHVQRGEDLYLTAAYNIPPHVLQIVAHVPRGKGMAGVAQVKKAPVQTCNLQTDDSGTIKPGAKSVDAQAAVALPVFDDDHNVRAVVGLAWKREGEIGTAEERVMLELVSGLPI